MQWRLLCFIGLSVTLAFSETPGATQCPTLSKEGRERVESYIGQRLVSGTAVKPLIKSAESLPESCYYKLSLTVNNAGRDFVMYLSPDERFLSSGLYDLSVDPELEVTRIADNVAKLLIRDKSPRFEGTEAKITMVEFVDFQCPYCKRFSDWYWDLPESLRSQITLIMKNLPLDQHPWARPAALYAVCADLQSPSAFREVSDFLFQEQSEITAANLKEKIGSGLRPRKTVDLQQLEACVSNKEASQILERDIGIAKQLNVSNTPTLFIDGRRVFRVSSADELQQLLKSRLANLKTTETPGGQETTTR